MKTENTIIAQNGDILIMQGGAIKALGIETKADGSQIGKVGGVLCRYTDPDAPDGYGDFFDKKTDFRFKAGMTCEVYFDHGMDSLLGVKVLALGVLSLTKEGVYVTGELDLSDPDSAAIFRRVQAGELGWSSGTAGHLVQRTQVRTYAVHGETVWHIDYWPLGLDASLTPWPAEPKNVATTVKSFKSLQAERNGEAPTAEAPTADVQHVEAGEPGAAVDLEAKAQLDALHLEALHLQAVMLRVV